MKIGLISNLSGELVTKGLVTKALVMVFSVAFVSCSDYSQKTVDVPDTSTAEAVFNSLRTAEVETSKTITRNFNYEIKYPEGHTTRLSVDYGSFNDRLIEARDDIVEKLGGTPYSTSEMVQEAINNAPTTIPAGGTMRITFYDKDKEKLDIRNFEFSLFADGERVIDTHTFTVSADPAAFNTNSAFFENSVELNIPGPPPCPPGPSCPSDVPYVSPDVPDVSRASVVSLKIYDRVSQTTTIFEMTNRIQN